MIFEFNEVKISRGKGSGRMRADKLIQG